jgi:transposase
MSWRRGQAYGQDLRDRVLACGDEPIRLVAARFSVSPSYVVKVRGRLRETGSAEPGPQCNHIPPRLLDLYQALTAQVTTQPDTTIGELRHWVLSTHGVRISHRAMWRSLAGLGLTRKKTSARSRAGAA